MTRRQFLFVSASATMGSTVWANLWQSQFEGAKKFRSIIDKAIASGWVAQDIGSLVASIGLEFLETPYVGWTLERDVEREFCFVTLEGLDCVTLFESSLGMARMLKRGVNLGLKSDAFTPEMLVQEVAYTRYRGGKVGDYLSRLHYTCDWMHDNVEKEVVAAIGEGMKGAKPLNKAIHFMSSHPETYRQIKANPGLIERLKAIESDISARDNMFVPRESVASNLDKFRSGDIIGLTTTMEGMDCAHTGLIRVEAGVPKFLHASSVAKKVVLDQSIDKIVLGNPKYTGLMVVRPVWR